MGGSEDQPTTGVSRAAASRRSKLELKGKPNMKRIILATTLYLHVAFLAASEPLPVPERGFVSAQPAKTWEEGLISGNCTIGANTRSRPLNDRVLFTH